MKTKSLILVFALFFSSLAFAQTEKGKFVVTGRSEITGGLGIHNYSFKNSSGQIAGGFELDSKHVGIRPEVGYFIVDNLMLGVSSLYSYEQVKNSNNPSYGIIKTQAISIMPTAQYYLPLGEKFRPVVAVMAGYMRVDADVSLSSAPRVSTPFDGFVYGLGAGVSYFVVENISLDLNITYENAKLSGINDEKYSAKINGIGASIGFSVYL